MVEVERGCGHDDWYPAYRIAAPNLFDRGFLRRFTSGKRLGASHHPLHHVCGLRGRNTLLRKRVSRSASGVSRTFIARLDYFCFKFPGQHTIRLPRRSKRFSMAHRVGLCFRNYFCMALEKFSSTFDQLRFSKKSSMYCFLPLGW